MSGLTRGTVIIGLLAMAGCGTSAPSEAPAATAVEIDFADAPLDMDAIDCDDLLTEEEVEGIVGEDVRPLGRSFSSCYWIGNRTAVQLVFNTQSVDEWRAALLETYTDRLPIDGVEVWAEPGSESIAGFGPGRGAVVHGVQSREEALAILLLALARL